MPCTISGQILTLNSDDSQRGMPFLQVKAQPSQLPLFVKPPGSSIFNPINNAGEVTSTDPTGLWSLTLPWPSECSPPATTWTVILPDGTAWQGTVPEGVTGPVSIYQLKNSYGWTNVQGFVPSTAPLPNAHAYTHEPGGSDDLFLQGGWIAPNRVDTCPRYSAANTAGMANGALYFSFFVPQVSLTVTRIGCVAASPQAGATLCRLGLYSSDASYNLTLLAQTANDTSIFTNTGDLNPKFFSTVGGFPASYTLQRGKLYGVVAIVAGATSAPQLWGPHSAYGLTGLGPGGYGPRMSSRTSGGFAADLPATFSNTGYIDTSQCFYFALLP